MARLRLLIPVLIVCVLTAVPVGFGASAAPPLAPGSVIATQELPRELWIPGTGRAHRVTYATTDHRGAPATSTGAVYLPPGPAPLGGWPVVSYAHGTVGVADYCAPSTVGLQRIESDYLASWLARGYAVVATDYLGLGTPGVLPYLDGKAAAHSVIDMVRAARTTDTGIAPRWMVIGLSQGGHAALLTARLATAYAPDLDYRGAVALGPPSSLDQLFPFGGPGFPNLGLRGLTVFSLYTIVGLRSVRPDLDLDGYLSPRGAELAGLAERLCTIELAPHVRGVQVGELFARSLGTGEVRSALTEYLGVPTSGYDRPVFIGHGVVDTVVPIVLTLTLVGDLQRSGTDVRFVAYPGVGHPDTLAASLADSLAFAEPLTR
ncbi:lipase family protein [Rhodococcus daqingensis]|uniref:Lipase family protein n=1 Tax=Rhodococcus daqingensis TaxID=2479363 RepID=A0ABW2S3V6_9NOCA